MPFSPLLFLDPGPPHNLLYRALNLISAILRCDNNSINTNDKARDRLDGKKLFCTENIYLNCILEPKNPTVNAFICRL